VPVEPSQPSAAKRLTGLGFRHCTGEWVMQRNFPALHDPLSSYSNTWLKLVLE